jgi:hypothetical protein
MHAVQIDWSLIAAVNSAPMPHNMIMVEKKRELVNATCG